MKIYKISLFTAFLLLIVFQVFAQIEKPATWSFQFENKEVKIGEEIDLIFKAEIQAGWYLYSSDFSPELGPTVTTFTFKPNNSYQLIGKLQAVGAKKKYDETWEGEYAYFKGKGEFRQKIKILKENPNILGSVSYQVCTEIDGKCIPGEEDFVLKGFKVVGEKNNVKDTSSIKNTLDSLVTSKKNNPETFKDSVFEEKKNTMAVATIQKPAQNIWQFALAAFLAGILALLTPCVYPMIPMTVSLFMNQGGNRKKAVTKALVYGFAIILIYTLIGTLISLLFGAEFANWISTHWLPNLLFFAIFIVFGLSFLGMFEIVLPSKLVNQIDKEADKGGYYGIFFMAFTLVVVSFSCTGPIAGSILIAAAQGELIRPIVGMVSFSLAFAIPFTLFAIFPTALKSLPKSGGWLNVVKVVLGFLELALALKFLSTADQVEHWRILDRDLFLAFWIVIFSFLGFYLLGKITLPHDNKLDKISVPRLCMAILVFTFVIYLVPGMFGAPLKPLAGYLPPQATHNFDLFSLGNRQSMGTPNSLAAEVRFGDKFKLPHGLQGFFDYKQALAYAKKVNKPLFIDFTGHGCTNCREMEARVWSDPQVLKRLNADYVLVALYVDDRFELPESEWYTSTYDQKVKKTIGSQNMDLQITQFKNNAQPYYCLLDTNGNLLIEPKAYDLSIENFTKFMDEGVKIFKEKQ